MPQTIYVIEFKTDEAVGLEKIKDKDYNEKYISDGKAIYLVAIEFDPSKRNITDVKWQRVG